MSTVENARPWYGVMDKFYRMWYKMNQMKINSVEWLWLFELGFPKKILFLGLSSRWCLCQCFLFFSWKRREEFGTFVFKSHFRSEMVISTSRLFMDTVSHNLRFFFANIIPKTLVYKVEWTAISWKRLKHIIIIFSFFYGTSNFFFS